MDRPGHDVRARPGRRPTKRGGGGGLCSNNLQWEFNIDKASQLAGPKYHALAERGLRRDLPSGTSAAGG
jgi:hypothetical protein